MGPWHPGPRSHGFAQENSQLKKSGVRQHGVRQRGVRITLNKVRITLNKVRITLNKLRITLNKVRIDFSQKSHIAPERGKTVFRKHTLKKNARKKKEEKIRFFPKSSETYLTTCALNFRALWTKFHVKRLSWSRETAV